MKKYILGAAALAVALIGFGTLSVTTTQANPSKIWVINGNVASMTATVPVTPAAFATALTTSDVTRAPYLTQFDAFVTKSAGQVAQTAAITAFSGTTYIVVQTDGSGTPVKLNGRGLTCTPLCDNIVTATPNAVDHIAVFTVTDAGVHSLNDTFVVTPSQDAVTLDSASLTIVGQARDLQLTAVKTTIQEANPSCLTTDSTSAPTRSAAVTKYTDINGVSLVGYFTTWGTSAAATLAVATTASPSMMQSDGKTIAAGNVICGVAAGTANLTASNTNPAAITGLTASTTRTQPIIVTGVPAKITPSAVPQTIACDGVASSTVTVKVTDSAGNNVVDNTPVTFSVVALGTANPVQTKTKDGSASSVVTPLSAATAGVTVIVTSVDVQVSTRIDCALPIPTAVPAASPTPRGGIVGPNTGNGGYLNQSAASGFPMWTLIALMLGSVTLVAGGLVTRRAGK